MIMRLITLVVFLFFSHTLFCQTGGVPSPEQDSLWKGWSASMPGNPDSLWNVWNDPAQEPGTRLWALNTIIWPLLHSDPDSARVLIDQELELSIEIGNKFWLGRTYYDLGVLDFNTSNYEEGKRQMLKALSIFDDLGFKQARGPIYTVLGNYYYLTEVDYGKSLEYHTKSQQNYEEVGLDSTNKNQIIAYALSYLGIGNTHWVMGNNQLALEAYEKGKVILEDTDDKRYLQYFYRSLGDFYVEEGRDKLALDYYKKLLHIMESIDDQLGLGSSNISIGGLFLKQAEYQSAEEYFRKALANGEKLGSKGIMGGAYRELGRLYNAQGKDTLALDFFLKALRLYEEVKEQNNIADIYSNMAFLFKSQQNYTQSL